MDIKKIIHISDIHIMNLKRHDEYSLIFDKFYNSLKEECNGYKYGEVKLVIAGDTVHQKITISNELYLMVSSFLRTVSEILPTIIIAGNHDLLENNSDRVDTITPIVKMLSLKTLLYMDMDLGYKSGYIVDNNIVWVLYSIFDNYMSPNIEEIKLKNPNKKIIGLFHGPLTGSIASNGYEVQNGYNENMFYGCDFVLAGDIHKRQEINYKGTKIVYCGSFIQRDYGETVGEHGYLSWNVDNSTYQEYNIDNDFSFYKMKISSINDIDNECEKIINL